MQFKHYLTEATLFNHPERGIEIRPDGGMGSWTIDRLVKDTIKQLDELTKKVNNGDFSTAEYILFKNGAFKAKISALVSYDKFKIKQGKRPIAKGKEIDLGESNLGESEMKYQALAMAKELHTALAELTFIEMLSVMDPNNPAKKEVQELETMINKLTTDVGEFIQKYIPDVADAETADVDELPDEEDAEDKLKPKAQKDTPKHKDKKDDSDESKEDKMKNVKDKKKELKESFRLFLIEADEKMQLSKKLNDINIDIKFKKSLLGDRGTNTKLVLDDIAKLQKEHDDIIIKLKA